MTSTNTTIQTRHDRRITVEYRDETTVLEIVNTSTGRVLGAGLTPVEARQIAAALTRQDGPWFLPDLMWLRADLTNQHPGGQWTREDLPDEDTLADMLRAIFAGYIVESGKALLPGSELRRFLDEVVEHLNAHHPKPDVVCIEAEVRRRTVALRENLHGVEKSRDEWERKYHEVRRELADEQGRNWGRHAAEMRIEQAERERDAAVARAEQAERERDEWKARAEDAIERARIADAECEEAKRAYCDFYDYATLSRTAPAVSREQWETVADHLWDEMVGSAKSVVRDAVARAFTAASIKTACEAEATPDPDPVEVKARELAQAGGIDFDEQEPDGVEMLIGMARHVLGQEADR